MRTTPPPEVTCGFSNTTGILWFIGVEVEQETNAPPPEKILDPPVFSVFEYHLSRNKSLCQTAVSTPFS